jgi:hypothetical protein
MKGYEREDGQFDIEGHMTDIKTYSFDNDHRGHIASGEPVHEMWIRMTVNDELKVTDVEAKTDFGPYEICRAINDDYRALVGTSLVAGWNHQVRKVLGGVHGCTHLNDMLRNMGTVAYQTMWPTLSRKASQKGKSADNNTPRRPSLLNTCHAYSSNSPVVQKQWPEFYTGDKSDC